MKRIVIDPGHGGKDPGAVANSLQEKNLALTISKYMDAYLKANYTGFEVKFTRTTDVFVELSKRADIANAYKADVFISNHVNAGKGSGYESFVYAKPGAAAIALQNVLHAESTAVSKKYDVRDRGKKRANLAVVRETAMPAILTEIGFIDSKDATQLKKDAFLRDMAAAYARGIAKHLGLPARQKVEKTGKIYRVQVGAFLDEDNAENLAAELKKKGYPVVIV